MPNLREILSLAVPTVTIVFGFLWYLGRKKPPRKNYLQSRDTKTKAAEQSTEDSVKSEVQNTGTDILKPKICNESVKGSELVQSSLNKSADHVTETEHVEEKVSQNRVQILADSPASNRKRKANRISREEMLEDEKGFDTVDEEIEREESAGVSLDASPPSDDNNKPVEVIECMACEDVSNLGSAPTDSGSTLGTLTDNILTVDNVASESIVSNKSLNLNDAFTSSQISEHLNDAYGTSETSELSLVTEKDKQSKVEDISLSTSTMEPLFESTMIDVNNQAKEIDWASEKCNIDDLSTKFDNSVSLTDTTSPCKTSEDKKTDISENHSTTNCSGDATSSVKRTSKLSERLKTEAKNSGKKDSVKSNNNNKASSDSVKQGSLKDKSLESQNNFKKDSAVSPLKKIQQSKGSESTTDSGIHGSDCDNASESSNDSGKGRSVTDLPSSPNVSPSPSQQIYQCNFPTPICGRLIGRHGRNINMIKEKSGANISLNANPFTPEFQICVIEGTKRQIDHALRDISRKFPEVDLSPVNIPTKENSPPQAPVLMPEIMQLSLPEGVSVDAVVSSIVDTGHIFIQQPTHPSFPSLERLSQFMMACYVQDGLVPQMPRPLEVGVICAAPMMDGWYRTQIAAVYEDVDECDVKYVDYGGYSRVKGSDLRQIRSDFMTLPFQACECYMANITPLQDEEYFSPEAAAVLEDLTQGKLLQAQVVGRSEGGIPYVHIYQINGDKVIFVNRELVNRSVTRWVEVLS